MCSLLPSPTPTSCLPPNCSLSFKITHWVYSVLLMSSWVCGHPPECAWFTRDYTLKENHKLSIAPQLVVWGSSWAIQLPMLDCWLAWSCACLVWVTTVSVSSATLRRHILGWSSPTADSYNPSDLFSLMSYKPPQPPVFVIYLPRVAVFSSLSYFLHFDHFWVSALATIHYMEKLLWWGLRAELICR